MPPIEHDPFLPQETLPGAPLSDVAEVPADQTMPTIGGDQVAQAPDLNRDLMDRELRALDRSLPVRSVPTVPVTGTPPAGQVPPYQLPTQDQWREDIYRYTPMQRRQPAGRSPLEQFRPDATVTTTQGQNPNQLVDNLERELDPNLAAVQTQGLGRSIWNSFAENFLRMGGADIPRGIQTITGQQDGLVARAANNVDDWMANNFQINPTYRDNLLVSVIAPAVGALGGLAASFFLTGGVATAASLTARAPVVGASVAARTGLAGVVLGQNATQTAARVGTLASSYSGNAAEQYRDAMSNGANWDDIIAASRLNGVMSGALDAIPVFRAFREVDLVTGNAIQRGLSRIMSNNKYRILETGSSEMFTEAAQQVISNLIASNIISYDPSRGTFEGVVDSGIGGFTAGALLQTIANMLPGGRRVHFPGPGTALTPTSGPTTPIGPVPWNLLAITDQSTRTEWNPPRTGIEGHEGTYFGLPTRDSRTDFIFEQGQRIRDLDDAWKKSNPEYVSDPVVGASLGFYQYLMQSERDFDRLRNLSPEEAGSPANQARLAEVQANREVVDLLMDPVRMVSKPTWVLQRPGKGKDPATFIRVATDDKGQPIRRDGKQQRVVGMDGKDYFVGQGQLLQVDNTVPENYVLSPQGQNMLRLARMRMEAAQQAAKDVVNAERQEALDAASGNKRSGSAQAAPAAAAPGAPTESGIPLAKVLAARNKLAKAGTHNFQNFKTMTDAETIAAADALEGAPGQPGQAMPPDSTPSDVDGGPLKPPPMTAEEQAAFDLLSGKVPPDPKKPARPTAMDTAAMQAASGSPRVNLDDLPGHVRQELELLAKARGIEKLPDNFTQEELVKAGVPEDEAFDAFNKIADATQRASVAAAGKIAAESTPPRRGIEGIMDFYADLPRPVRRQIRKLLAHFERHIGRQISDLDVLDLATWEQQAGPKFTDPDAAAKFMYGRFRALGDGLERAALAIRTYGAGDPAAAKAIRIIAHELTHFMVGLTRQNRTDMMQLWVQLSTQMPNDPVVQEVIRLYGADPRTNKAEIMAQEYLALKLEDALAGRYETEFEKLAPGQSPSLVTYIKEMIRRAYQFVADAYDAIMGRDMIRDLLGKTSAQFGIDLDTYTADTKTLYSPYADDRGQRTSAEVFAIRKSRDATVPETQQTISNYWAVRFRGARAFQRFDRYMARELGDTWKKVSTEDRRQIWDNAVLRTADYSIDNAYRSGSLTGAPNNMTMITDILGMARRGEGPNGEGRYWYQLSAEEVGRRFRENADTYLKYLSVTSSGVGVASGMTQSLSAMAQASIRGKIETNAELGIKNVGFPESQQAAQEILATGEWAPTAQKTQQFYRALAKHLGIRDYGAVVDRWMMRALGYDTDNPGPAQYAHAQLIIHTAAEALGWSMDETQAALWVAIKMESARKQDRDVRNYGDLIKLNERAINFAIAPANSTEVGKALAAMDYVDRERIYARVVADVMPEIVKIIGVDVYHPTFEMTHGGYNGQVNPTLETSMPLPEWAARTVAVSFGYIFKQAAVLTTRPTGGKDKTAYFAMQFVGGTITPDKATEFWAHAMRANPNLNGGYTFRDGTMFFYNLRKEDLMSLRREAHASKMTDKDFRAALQTAAETFTGHGEIRLSTDAGAMEAHHYENDWSKNPNGESYRSFLELVRPGLADELHSARARTDAIFAEELEAAGLWSPRQYDESTAGRAIAPSIPVDGPVDIYGPQGRRSRADPGELAGRIDEGVSMPGVEPGALAHAQIFLRAGIFQGGVDTTRMLRVYDLNRIMVDPDGFKAFLGPFRLDPNFLAGLPKTYAHAWRVSHALAKGLVHPLIQAKYGPETEGGGRLGRDDTMTLREAQRTVEWEATTLRAQRSILQDFGVEITDDQFAQTANTVIPDTIYRVVTGERGDPGSYGFVPASKVGDLGDAMRLLEQYEFAIAIAQGRDPTRGVPLDSGWTTIPEKDITDQIARGKAEGLSKVSVNVRDDYQGEFFENTHPSSSTEMTSPLAYTNLHAAVLNATMRAGTPGEWKRHFRTQQVPMDEIRWSGMFDWLDSRKGAISRDLVRAYSQAAEMIVDGRLPGTLTLRSNPFDQARTVVSLRYAPRTDTDGRSLVAISGIVTNQAGPRAELAIRRAVRWAAEEGFDGVTWLDRHQMPAVEQDTHWSGDTYKRVNDGLSLTATYMPETTTAYIEAIRVQADARKQGTGRKAITDFEKAVASRGGARIEGDALPASVGFWERMGYTVDPEFNEVGGTYAISKDIQPNNRGEAGLLDQVGESARKVAKAFNARSADAKIVNGQEKPTTASAIEINEAMADSVDNMDGLAFARIFRQRPPGFPPAPGAVGSPNNTAYWRRLTNWYQDFDALFMQSSKRIRILGGRVKAAFELGNHFRRDTWSYVAPGQQGKIDQDYHSVVNGLMGKYLPKLGARMSKLSDTARAELAEVLRGGNVNPATGRIQISRASGLTANDARWFRNYLNTIRDELNAHMQGLTNVGRGAGSQYVKAGVPFGTSDLIQHLADYFPQIWTLDAKFDSSSPFNGLSKAAVAHAFFKGLGFYGQHQQQNAQLDELIGTIRGEQGFVSYASTNTWRPGSTTKFSQNLKERVLKINPNKLVSVTVGGVTADVKLGDFLNNDPVEVLVRYTTTMSRHAEFNRRFGPKGEEIDRLINNINSELQTQGRDPLRGGKLDSLIYQVHANLYAHQKRPSEKWANRQEWAKFTTNVGLLMFTTIASLPEVAMTGVRLGLRGQMNGLAAGVKQLMSSATGHGATNAKQLAVDLGIIRDHMQSSILSMVQDYGNYTANRWTDKLFYATMLNQWTKLTMTMGTSAAIRSLPRWAADAQNGSQTAQRWLREVGLDASDLTGVDPNTYRAGQSAKVDAAIRQIVGEIVVNPTVGMLPGWHSDPRFRLVAHIKAFMTGFGNTVVQRPIREIGNGNMMPLVWLGMYAALAALTAQLWEWVLWGAQGNPGWRRAGLHDRPETQFMLNTISRGGLAGPYQMFIDAIAMNRTASGGSSVTSFVPAANIADRLWNFGASTMQVVVSGGQNERALHRMVDYGTQLVPVLSATGGHRRALVDTIAPPPRPVRQRSQSQNATW